ETAAEQLLDTLEILTPALSARAAASPEGLQHWVGDLAAGGLRLTLVASDGTVLADSARTAAQVGEMDNHLSRPEIVDALATGAGSSVRWSATTGLPYAYAARTVTAPDGRLYVVRLAQPLGQLTTFKRQLALGLIVALSAGLAAALAIYLWIARRLIRPVARMAEGAAALAAGDYSERLDPPEERHMAALAEAFNRMAGRVEEQMAAVRAERDHLEAIVSSMSDGVLVTDRAGRALLVNPELRRLFGVERPPSDRSERRDRLERPAHPDRRTRWDPRGRLPLEIVRQPELARLVERTLAEGESFNLILELREPERRILALTSAALTSSSTSPGPDRTSPAAPFDPAGPEGAVVVARDVTHSMRLDEMRRDFVANVSHELKTPLSAIRGLAETLRDGALEDAGAARRFTERILAQCRRLQELLDDLLALSRLEASDRRAEPEPVDLLAIARRAVDTVHETATARGVEVSLRPPERRPPLILGERESLERLLLNLLENGVKYNRPGGRVEVALGVVREADGEAVLIEVSDTGIGIPEADLPRIFERFYRVEKGRSRDVPRNGRTEGGTGLGLAIVKHIAQSHGGRVEVESEAEVGTTFRVHLPLGVTSAPRGTAG
ncbi:MAG: ATP-binding protein, partial [Acidobacteriota bacterium]